MPPKDRTVIELVERLAIGGRGWMVADHPMAGSEAIALTSSERDAVTALVSTRGLPAGHFSLVIEEAALGRDFDHQRRSEYDAVAFKDLVSVLEDALGSQERLRVAEVDPAEACWVDIEEAWTNAEGERFQGSGEQTVADATYGLMRLGLDEQLVRRAGAPDGIEARRSSVGSQGFELQGRLWLLTGGGGSEVVPLSVEGRVEAGIVRALGVDFGFPAAAAMSARRRWTSGTQLVWKQSYPYSIEFARRS